MAEKQYYRLVTDKNLQEILPDFSYDFPMAVYGGQPIEPGTPLDCVVPWHWHSEFEINIVSQGKERMFFNEESLDLADGEGIFINSNTLHMSKPLTEDGHHTSFLFNAALLNGSPRSVIDKRYVQPIINSEALRGMRLSREIAWQAEILLACMEIKDAYLKKNYGFELLIQQKLTAIWHTFVLNTVELVEASVNKKVSVDDGRVKTMMLYIHDHYSNELTLEEIAASASISVSECCRCFKRVLSMTPFAYLIEHRLNTAAILLRNTSKPVSEVARDVGFDTESYFSQKFRVLYQCTPSQYRKNA